MQTLKEWIRKLSEELAIDVPKKDLRDPIQLFPIHSDLVLSFSDLDPGVSIQADLDLCPEKGREELFLLLMRANMLGQGTGGARIGMKEDEKTLTLSVGMPYELSYEEFRDRVEEFVNYLTYWREEIGLFKKKKASEA